MTRTGHPEVWPDRAWPITSSRTPFFCVVNVRVAKVERDKASSGHVRMSRRSLLTKSCTSQSRKG
jgi:hypothetical protein